MKKMITKTAIVSAVAFALVALPVSARSRTTADTRDDNDNRPMMPMMMMQGGGMMGGMQGGMGGNMGGNSNMGNRGGFGR